MIAMIQTLMMWFTGLGFIVSYVLFDVLDPSYVVITHKMLMWLCGFSVINAVLFFMYSSLLSDKSIPLPKLYKEIRGDFERECKQRPFVDVIIDVGGWYHVTYSVGRGQQMTERTLDMWKTTSYFRTVFVFFNVALYHDGDPEETFDRLGQILYHRLYTIPILSILLVPCYRKRRDWLTKDHIRELQSFLD